MKPGGKLYAVEEQNAHHEETFVDEDMHHDE
jgi:hypothetical protein